MHDCMCAQARVHGMSACELKCECASMYVTPGSVSVHRADPGPRSHTHSLRATRSETLKSMINTKKPLPKSRAPQPLRSVPYSTAHPGLPSGVPRSLQARLTNLHFSTL